MRKKMLMKGAALAALAGALLAGTGGVVQADNAYPSSGGVVSAWTLEWPAFLEVGVLWA